MKYKALHDFYIDIYRGYEHKKFNITKNSIVTILYICNHQDTRGEVTYFYQIELPNGFEGGVEYSVFQSCFEKVPTRRNRRMRNKR